MTWNSPTNITWNDGLGSLFVYLNQVTNSWVTNMLLMGIYILFLAGYYKSQDDMFGAMAVAGAITFVIALIFFVLGLLSWVTMSIVIGVAIIGAFALFFKDIF